MCTLTRAPITVPSMNPWESHAMSHNFPREASPGAEKKLPTQSRFQPGQDPIIYPGLYAPSGIDIMSILFSVLARPDPKFELGPVDCSAALTVSNLDLPGSPIIYANEAFSKLTGYTISEVLGQNPRFLHSPQSIYPFADTLLDQHSAAIQSLDQAVASRNEIQLHITNYKKNGQKFTNLLSMIPIRLPDNETQYSVGFHVAADAADAAN
ncbi:GATA transcription factor LreA [Cordyceps fumosorosea ARSEF 2679]|uniref:GATA transcription factor LreA n=1 Tax=Cordyceps fumosorosea (strain ARSEF 2679) TaxID=1081104 RepID=A0A168BSN5_CORFA|nr:GATA transcription factor LreA [Cordyceps fumosorosea ARSEF 2679]OAA70497.1 GATA transcription factor LreA [Cordyceps fumosorosea ARSEF 2679]